MKPFSTEVKRLSNRSGMTALDVVITLLVLMILIAILLPMMIGPGGSREAPQRSGCKYNLKLLGIALHNYHDTHNTFPPGWVAVQAEERASADGELGGPTSTSAFGWGTYILPFFDQAPLYKRFETDAPIFAEPNREAAGTVLTMLRCHSDQGDDQTTSSTGSPFGTTNYVGNFGVGVPTGFVETRHVQGIFGRNSSVRFRDLKDGSSNVVLVGERRMPASGADWIEGKIEGPFGSYWCGIPRLGVTSPLAIVGTATLGETDLIPMSGPLYGANTLSHNRNPLVLRVNTTVDVKPWISKLTSTVTGGFSSWHTGGCQILLGDGTVRFVNENIDDSVLVNLMRRADGETLGAF